MTKDVLALAQEDTRLHKESVNERAGPCPDPDCDRQTNGFRVKWFHDEQRWKFMCRGCFDAQEQLPDKGRKRGWGDEIDYLRHYRKMSFKAAKAYIEEKQGVDLRVVHSVKQPTAHDEIPGQYWQMRYDPFVVAATARLWTPEGRECLDYLGSRGLSDETLKKARLGYAVRNRRPCIVVPWWDDREQGYWRVSLRDITPGIPKEQRYKNTLAGFSEGGMYLGDSLKRKLPTFLVEGEMDALSIAQVAGDLVNVVATGSIAHGKVPKWIVRLARMPSVLVAFDRDSEGDKAAQEWLNLLNGATQVLRYRPLAHDANDMLVQGYDIRSWVAAALDYLSDQDAPQPATDWICAGCGIDLSSVETAAYSPDGLAYCNYDENFVAYCSRKPMDYEQFIAYANRLAAGLTERTGAQWTLKRLEQGYTLKQHIATLQEQRAVAEPTADEHELMARLKGYGLELGESCKCGCRLKWRSAGSIVCARCEPGGLWSHQSLELLSRCVSSLIVTNRDKS